MTAGGVRVVEVDVHDDAALQAWHDVQVASSRHRRPHASLRTHAALTAMARHPSPYRRVVLLAAVGPDDRVLGVVEISWALQDNLHLAEVYVDVHPDHRRRGLGRALHDAADAVRRREGRSTVTCEVVAARDDGDHAGLAFARSLGYGVVHTEEHLLLDLPADVRPLARETPGHRVLTWVDRCPEEHVAGFAALRSRMNQDVPAGEVARDAVTVDVERLRTSEERMLRSYTTIVAVAVAADGAYAGYSTVFVAHGADDALQDDTLVMPEHRGHGLGLQLKVATMAVLAAEHPDRRVIHTWTDPDNAAMLRTNRRFGYRPVEVMREVQHVD